MRPIGRECHLPIQRCYLSVQRQTARLERPGEWNLHFLRNFVSTFGLISSVFDFITFGVLRLAFNADEDLFRSGWFLESVATELAIMLILRTRRPFFRSAPGRALLGKSLAVASAALALPYS